MRTGVPGVQRLLETAAAVGEHDRAAARAGRRTDSVDDGLDALALVVVGAAEEDQELLVARADRADLAGVAGDRRRENPGRSVVSISAVASPSASTAGSQPGAEHQRHVVALDAGQLGEPLRGVGGEVVRGILDGSVTHPHDSSRARWTR